MLMISMLAVSAIPAFGQVPYKRILGSNSDPSTWLTYSGNYQSQRFTRLNQINRDNVSQLKLTWVYQMRSPGLAETSPIVADGVMYITEPRSSATALDLRTGRLLWSYVPRIPSDVLTIGSPGPVNRGVAILDDKVFLGTINCHLVALDAKTGIVRWDIAVGDNKKDYYITAAPLAIDGKILVGVAGADAGIRGFVDAYDPNNGKRLWRAWTVPGPGEPGIETWSGGSEEHGGGSTWVTGSFDPDLQLVYWGTGNPGPSWNGDKRPGDNLYTCSLIALDAATGKIKWHFQFTPHDLHDWDASQVPVLFDLPWKGRIRKFVATANKNGFYYVLDRETGEFVTGTAFAKQTWAEGIDPKGRPILRSGTDPTNEGTLVYPDGRGAANWYSPSYSPQTKLFYQAVREDSAVYYKGEDEYVEGRLFGGSGLQHTVGDEVSGAVRALDATTGKLMWEFKLFTPPMAGLLTTGGGLVFGGSDEGNFFALDAENGHLLWESQLGAAIVANPVSFEIDGKQQVAITAGSSLFVFGLH